MRESIDTEVLVVGAGITGALAAYELTAAGARVVVVDARDVATGSSGASTGMLLYDTDTSLDELARQIGPDAAARVYRLGIEAVDGLERAVHDLAIDCGFARRPSLYLASTRGHVRALRREFEARKGQGLDVEWLDRAGLASRYAFAGPAAILAGGTAEVDCYRLTHGLLHAAVARGARVFDRTSVSNPAQRDGTIEVETGDGYRIRAARVVWATGYEAHEFLNRKTAPLASTWVFVSEPIDDLSRWPDRCLIWETARPYMYLRTTDDGRLLAGGEDEPCAECHRSTRWFGRKINRLAARAKAMFPTLPVDVAFAWAGTFAISPDGLPFIGTVPEHPGVWFALGYGGNGITFSWIAAQTIRRAYLGQSDPDAWMFAFDRRDRS